MNGPVFVDNLDGNTFARAIRSCLEDIRERGVSPEELCIATGYFNAAGWLCVADEAERMEKVRLLIGAEPTPASEIIPRRPGEPREPERTRRRVRETLNNQIKGLKQERDQGFDFNPGALENIRKLVEFFRSGKVEVRRYEERFFHAKAWIIRGDGGGFFSGSSNLTAAGMTRNLELNIGRDDGPLTEDVEKWFDGVWEEAIPFELADLYEELFHDFPPWLIYLRVLWELYGAEIEEEPPEVGHLSLTRFQKHGVWRARRLNNRMRPSC